MACYYLTSGENNVILGRAAGERTRSGNNNTFIGPYAGYYNETGSSNICIGNYAGKPANTNFGDYGLYIDTRGSVGALRGTESLIYGDQSSTNALTLNADVTIADIEGVCSGNLTCAGSFSQGSDRRLKKQIQLIDENISDKIDLLKPVTYILKSSNKEDVGFIAQDVEPIFPLLVTKSENGFLNLKYSSLTPYLVKSLQETHEKIRHLEEKIRNLEERIETITIPTTVTNELVLNKISILRRDRDEKLQESDKYMLHDYPITEEKREEWKVYRQALRDITDTQSLDDIEVDNTFKIHGCNWPTPPSP